MDGNPWYNGLTGRQYPAICDWYIRLQLSRLTLQEALPASLASDCGFLYRQTKI